MRLPRSSSSHLSIRIPFFTSLIAVAAVLSLGAQASTRQLVCSPTNIRFGAVALHESAVQVVVLTNTGQSSAKVSAISMSGAEFTVGNLTLPLTLAAGQSVPVTVTFSPTAMGWTGGKATVTSTASNPSLELAVRGVGVGSDPLTAVPANVSFNQVAVGAQATVSVALTNPHNWSVTLSALEPAGTGFSVSSPALPVTLSKGQSVTFSVTFAPKSPGQSGGRVFVSGPAFSVPLTGTGTTTMTGSLAVSPASLSFGSVMIGTTGTQTGILTATGGSVTIASAASSNNQFTLPGASFPMTLAAGQSVQFNVAFSPQQAGTASAKLSFSSNASNSQATEAAAGTGTAPQVSLGWSPSTSDVQGYNVYRGTAPGVYSKLNASLDSSTTYTDATVTSGKTYYYAATAVSSSGQESSYSAPVAVSVP